MNTGRYAALRNELVAIQTAFEKEAVRDLHCQRLFNLESVTAEGWQEFEEANGSADEQWVSDGEGCLRFHGDIAGYEEFERSANSAWMVLATLGREFPVLNLDLGEFAHEFGWIDRVFHTAEAVASARLHIEGDWWNWPSEESPAETLLETALWSGDGESRSPRHPMVQRLPVDLFRASAEAIRVWLDPDSISTVGDRIDDDLGIRLPIALPVVLTTTPERTLTEPQKPRWGEQARTLWWGDDCLKRFGPQARVLILIMQAFEQAGWKESIPLPPEASIKQASDAFRDLKFNKPNVIHFWCHNTQPKSACRLCWGQFKFAKNEVLRTPQFSSEVRQDNIKLTE